jgi:hypothetical protein
MDSNTTDLALDILIRDTASLLLEIEDKMRDHESLRIALETHVMHAQLRIEQTRTALLRAGLRRHFANRVERDGGGG